MDEHQNIAWNEAMAQKYDPEAYHLRSNFIIRWIERCRVNTIIKLLQSRTDHNVLEVGCGAGNVLVHVKKGHLYGIDLSKSLIKKSTDRLSGKKTHLYVANAEHLPFGNGIFDRIICTEVLEHVVNPSRVVEEISRVATRDAIIVITIPNEKWITRIKHLIGFFRLSRWLLSGSQDDSYHSPEKMTDEWHIHNFDYLKLVELTNHRLLIHRHHAIPFGMIPLRFVVSLSQINWIKDAK